MSQGCEIRSYIFASTYFLKSKRQSKSKQNDENQHNPKADPNAFGRFVSLLFTQNHFHKPDQNDGKENFSDIFPYIVGHAEHIIAEN